MSLNQHIKKIENYDLIKPHLSEFSESAVLDSLSNVILKYPQVIRPNAGALKVLNFLKDLRQSTQNLEFDILTFEDEWWTHQVADELSGILPRFKAFIYLFSLCFHNKKREIYRY